MAGKFALVAGEDVLIWVCSDLTGDRIYGVQWVLVTPERAVLAPEAGVDDMVEVATDQVRAARTEALVGGGRLEIER